MAKIVTTRKDNKEYIRSVKLLISASNVDDSKVRSLEWLATRPGDIVAYARKTLFNLDA